MNRILLKFIKIIDQLTQKQNIPVLYYHRINDVAKTIDGSPGTEFFYKQIEYLCRRGYSFASLLEIIQWSKGEIKLPEKAIGISFDDGFEDNYHNAFPVIKEFRAKATIFLIYNYIGSYKYFSYNRPTPQKILPEDYNPSKDIKHTYLNKEQIIEMFDSSLIDFGAHTVNHVSLTFNDLKNAKREIIDSKKLLEENLSIPIKTFCYPYGHYNETIKKIVKKAGYEGAFTTMRGKVKQGADIYSLPRWNDINLLVNLPPGIRKIDKISHL